MNPDAVEIVLVRPSRAGNVAASCRAMKNMGLRVLRLVDPPPTLAQAEVRALAYGAWDVLDGAVRARTVREAVAGATIVVGTSGRAEAGALTPRAFAAEAAARAGGGRVSVVFGPEATGLRRDELDLCHLRVHIPTHPGHPSLNLAQAVLIVAYEIQLLAGQQGVTAPGSARATSGELEQALDHLGQALLAIGYLNPRNPGAILAEFRALLARAGPTPREVVLLRGLARQVGWAGCQIARGPGAIG